MKSYGMLLALAGIAWCGGTSIAQQPAGPPLQSPSTALFVLQSPAAQRELRLDRKQLKMVGGLSRDMQRATAAAQQGREAALREATQQLDQTVRESLSESQLQRLEQLVVQLPTGPEVYARPQMAEQLRLNQQQVAQINLMQQQMQLALQELQSRGLDARQLAEARYGLMRQMQNEAAANVLNDAQRAAMIDLAGPRFEWTPVLMPWRTAAGPR